MRAHSRAVIEAGGVLREVASTPPLTLRRVQSDEPDVCRVCLVGSAAGPLAGDDVLLELTVCDGARAELVAAGASIAQGRAGERAARLSTMAGVGEHAELMATPGPVIVCAGSELRIEVQLRLAATATVHWRELLVLGRSGESPGSVRLDWDVERAGMPVLRQRIDLTDARLVNWPGMLSGQRVLASSLITGPDVQAHTTVLDSTGVAQQVDEHTVLVTVLDASTAEAQSRLDQLIKIVLA